MIKIFLFAILFIVIHNEVSSSSGTPKVVNLIPGDGCGGPGEPYKIFHEVPENEEDRACSVITSDESYKKFITANPKWVAKSAWSTCSKTCEGGTKERQRKCQSGRTQFSPDKCGQGQTETETRKCNTLPCAEWSEWSRFESCSTKCSAHKVCDVRDCLNADNNSVKPLYCHGKEEDKQRCQPCALFDTAFLDGTLLETKTNVKDTTECSEICETRSDCELWSFDIIAESCLLQSGAGELLNYQQNLLSGPCANLNTLNYSALMIIGGSSASTFHEVEVVDLSGNEQSCFKPSDYPVEQASTGKFFDGFPLVCGGRNGSSYNSECHKYNFQTDSWLPAMNMSKERGFASSSLLSRNEFWVSGGIGGQTTSEILYSGSNSFQSYVDLPENMHYHTMIRLNDSVVFFVGNERESDRVYMFDKTTQNFTGLPQLATPRRFSRAGVIQHQNGTINLVVTGGSKGPPLRSTEVFDFHTMTWSYGEDFPDNLAFGASVQFGNTFLVVGGFRNSFDSESIREFDPDSMRWITRNERLELARHKFITAFLIPDEVARCTP